MRLNTIYRFFAVLVLLVASGLMIGCGASNSFPVGTFERGMEFIEQEKYPEAAVALDSYIRHNPTDSLASEAQYQKALTYMKLKEYPLAAVEFQILRKDYPVCNRIEDAYYQEGLAYFRQVGRVERDVTGAYEARLHFMKFAQQFPNSDKISDVIAIMLEISDLMVTKRLKQVEIYARLHKWEAVAITLDDVIQEERSSTILDQVLFERARAAREMDDQAREISALQRIVKDFAEGDYADKAKSRLEKLAQETDTKEES